MSVTRATANMPPTDAEAGITSPHDPTTNPTGDGTAIPEKFQNEDGTLNQEALLKSYAHLESGKPAGGDETPIDQAQPKVEIDSALPFDYAKAEGGLMGEAAMAQFQTEYNASLAVEGAETGSLSDESYAALDAGGYPRAIVDDFISTKAANVAATSTARDTEIMAAAGDTPWETLTEWAGDNLSDGEIETFNTAVQNPDLAIAKAAVESLAAKRTSKTTKHPENPVTNTFVPGAPTDVYADMGEFVRDTQNPKYKSDPNGAFATAANAKLGRSPI